MADGTRESGTFTLAATGDAEITQRVLVHEGSSNRFDAVLSRLRDASAAVTNLEFVACEKGSYATPPRQVKDFYQYLSPSPGMVLWADPKYLDELTGMGFNLFSTASNHTYDFGRCGMVETMAQLEARDMTYAGLGQDLPDARSPSYLSTPEGRVGLVTACTSIAPGSEAGQSGSILPGRPGINPLHLNWTYKVPPHRLTQLEEIGELVGIEAAKESWLAREDWSQHADDVYEFMQMAFEPVENESEVGIEYTPYAPDKEPILRQVSEANAQSDWVVMTVHSHQGKNGKRNVQETPPFLVEFAHECIDAGADTFVCTGPHMLRGIEVYDGKPIFYSLGNFIRHIETQDQLPREVFEYHGIDDDTRPSQVIGGSLASEKAENPSYWRTILPTCRFTEDGDVETIELLPCSLGYDQSRARRGTPMRATADQSRRILDDLQKLSSLYGTDIEIDDGVGVIRPS